MQPFAFIPHATQTISLADTVVVLTLDKNTDQVWIDNRGETDVLVEYFDDPVDANSFRVAGGCAQPVTMPETDVKQIRLKRPSGSMSANVFVTSGMGF